MIGCRDGSTREVRSTLVAKSIGGLIEKKNACLHVFQQFSSAENDKTNPS